MTGAQIREGRLAKEWTQAQLAVQLGVVVETVSRWEQERVRPPMRSEIALRHVLDIDESKPVKSKRRKS
jgi:transcriptional regulator with XRE-family HTH domain